MDPIRPRPPSDSAVESTHLVLPPDTNALGSTFGGRIMQWMDIAAGIAANRHCGHTAVTAELNVRFCYPIVVGTIAEVRARVARSSSRLYVLEGEVVQDGQVKAIASGKFIRQPQLAEESTR